MQDYNFKKTTNTDELTILKNEWLKSQTIPQDGFWEYIRSQATNWGIYSKNELIGYALINKENKLLQFYITPIYLFNGEVIFNSFINELKIGTGYIETSNLTYLSIALNFVKELKVKGYSFRSNYDVSIEEKEGELVECKADDLERLIDFNTITLDADKEWLKIYLGGLIEKRELFYLEKDNIIIGTCEVRSCASSPDYNDLGMIVSKDFRKQGYGTYLLYKAKQIAIKRGKTPICACAKDNIGSFKAITNCGFISQYQLLSITFK